MTFGSWFKLSSARIGAARPFSEADDVASCAFTALGGTGHSNEGRRVAALGGMVTCQEAACRGHPQPGAGLAPPAPGPPVPRGFTRTLWRRGGLARPGRRSALSGRAERKAVSERRPLMVGLERPRLWAEPVTREIQITAHKNLPTPSQAS
jgi:hypothetical protein